MKSSELRMGNWVNDAHGDFEWEFDCFKDWYVIDEVNPIPLTEGWLKEFGFKKIEISKEMKENLTKYELLNFNGFVKDNGLPKDYPSYFSLEYYPNVKEVYIGNGYRKWILRKDVEFNMPLRANIESKVEYVHQMQNLYFALTGEELIRKE